MTFRPILFLLLLLSSMAVHSAAAIAPNPVYKVGGFLDPNACSQLCTADANNPAWGANAPSCSNAQVSGLTCTYTLTQFNPAATYYKTYTGIMYCPIGYTVSQDGTQCIPVPDGPCADKKGQSASMFIANVPDATSIGPYIDVCNGSCAATLANARPMTSRTTGQINMVGTWTYTGKACEAGDPVASTGGPDVNQPDDPNSDDTITKTCANNPGGGHTTTYTITHSDGSKDFQYVTLAGSCSGANDDPNAEKDFCRENPTAPACKDFCADNPSSCVDRNSDGGQFCAAPPVCTGDEIDCASLFQQWTTRCAFETDGFTLPEAPAKTPAEMVAAENSKITGLLDDGKAVEIYNNFKLLDWSTWIPVFPAASCAPFTGTVAGRSVSIDICSKVAMINELIGWLFAVFGAWTVVMTIYKRD